MAVQRIGDFSLLILFQAIRFPRLLPLSWYFPGSFTQERFCFSCYRQNNHPTSLSSKPFHPLYISHSILIATSTYSFITFGDEGWTFFLNSNSTLFSRFYFCSHWLIYLFAWWCDFTFGSFVWACVDGYDCGSCNWFHGWLLLNNDRALFKLLFVQSYVSNRPHRRLMLFCWCFNKWIILHFDFYEDFFFYGSISLRPLYHQTDATQRKERNALWPIILMVLMHSRAILH